MPGCMDCCALPCCISPLSYTDQEHSAMSMALFALLCCTSPTSMLWGHFYPLRGRCIQRHIYLLLLNPHQALRYGQKNEQEKFLLVITLHWYETLY